MKKPVYCDLADIKEDERINIIGRTVTEAKQVVSFIVDDELDKPERYIRKLTTRFAGIAVLAQFKGPIKGTVTVKVGPLAGAQGSD